MITIYKSDDLTLGYYYCHFPSDKVKFELREFDTISDKLSYLHNIQKEVLALNIEAFHLLCSEQDDSQIMKEYTLKLRQIVEWIPKAKKDLPAIRKIVRDTNDTFVVMMDNLRAQNSKIDVLYLMITHYCTKGKDELTIK